MVTGIAFGGGRPYLAHTKNAVIFVQYLARDFITNFEYFHPILDFYDF